MPQLSQSDRLAAGTDGSPLPPSVEKAYYVKCVQLKRRIREIEESNDSTHVRNARLRRAIMKLELQQAILLGEIEKIGDDEAQYSSGSDQEPATPEDKPTRSKRPGNRKQSPTTSTIDNADGEPGEAQQAVSRPDKGGEKETTNGIEGAEKRNGDVATTAANGQSESLADKSEKDNADGDAVAGGFTAVNRD